MSDQRARVVLDAPVSDEALGLLTPIVSREIAEEVRAVYQNSLRERGIGTRFESESSQAAIHVHAGTPCGACREHALDGIVGY